MQESAIITYWSLLHPLGQCLIIALSFSLILVRYRVINFSDKLEKYFRSFALGAELALLFWPLFPSLILRGRVDLSLWLIIPILWAVGVMAHFLFVTFTKERFPLRDYSLVSIVVLFFLPWFPIIGTPVASGKVLWPLSALVLLLGSEIKSVKMIFCLPVVVFVTSLLGFFFSSWIPLFLAFLIGIWSFGLFREMLVLFSFFQEGNKRIVPALIAFSLTMATCLALT